MNTHKQGKTQHRELFALISEVIADWDPYSLVSSGSPSDEFDAEIASLAKQVPRIHSSTDAAHAISRTFSSSFSDSERFTPEMCAEVGKRLFSELQSRDYVSKP